jgi:hypothetical protein
MYIRLVTISGATIEWLKNVSFSDAAQHDEQKKEHRKHRNHQDEHVCPSPTRPLVFVFLSFESTSQDLKQADST